MIALAEIMIFLMYFDAFKKFSASVLVSGDFSFHRNSFFHLVMVFKLGCSRYSIASTGSFLSWMNSDVFRSLYS